MRQRVFPRNCLIPGIHEPKPIGPVLVRSYPRCIFFLNPPKKSNKKWGSDIKLSFNFDLKWLRRHISLNLLKLPVWYKILVSWLHVFHVMNFENWFKIFAVFSNTTFKTEKYLFWSHLNCQCDRSRLNGIFEWL